MTDAARHDRLVQLDHRHVWHPFTPMRQWMAQEPMIIERGEGCWLIDTRGRRYIDGTSSLWCNVHGHRHPAIDAAVRDQLDRIAHSTLLGLASPPSIELAARLCALAPKPQASNPRPHAALSRVFYSDAGAAAVEAALKMAVGYWHYRGRPNKNRFIALGGAYHGDTVGAMSVGYDEVFNRPYNTLTFPTRVFPAPDAARTATQSAGTAMPGLWPCEDSARVAAAADASLAALRKLLEAHADETAGVIIEPVVQGAAGMLVQPPGFVRAVADLVRAHGTLFIVDEVAVGFGRTGAMFASEHDGVTPDIMCLGKGITAGYLPLAATLATEEVFEAYLAPPGSNEFRGFLHGHTYTGNALACAAALASLDLFEKNRLLEHVRRSTELIRARLEPLRGCPHVLDVRQRGLMAGIELGRAGAMGESQMLDYTRRTGAAICAAIRERGAIVRPLGDVIVLMPILATPHDVLTQLCDTVVETILTWRFE